MPKKIKVILTEKHSIQRQSMCVLLELETDIDVIGAKDNLTEALDLARDIPSDVFVVDLSIPYQNGTETLQKIKQELPDIGIVAITQYEDEEYINKLLIAGVSGLVLKDTTMACLVNAVHVVGRGKIYISPKILASWQNTYKPVIPSFPVQPQIQKVKKSFVKNP